MKTIVLEEIERLVRADTAVPTEPSPGTALVRIRHVGVCGTDLHAYRGRQPFFSYPRSLGHELGVEVLETRGDDPPVAAGARCAVEPYYNCGNCQACRRGLTNCCVELQVLGVHADGGMREIFEVRLDKLHPSEVLTTEQLALVETLGIGAHAVERAALQREEAVLIIGAGPIGLATLVFARLAGARISVLELNADRTRFVREQFGVEHCLDGSGDVIAQLEDALDGDLPTAVFDATGNPASMTAAPQYVASGGKLVYVGFVMGEVGFTDAEMHRKELTILRSRNSHRRNFQQILKLMEEDRFDTRPWITHRAAYDDFVEKFPGWLDARAGVVKAMLEL